MRATAEVHEGPVSIQRDPLHPLVAHQVLDQLDLVRLLLGAEALDRLAGGALGALEGLIGFDVSRHPLLDSLQVRLGGPESVRELEVVIEAVLDRGADRDLGARPQVEHRGCQHVGAIVAKDLEGPRPAWGQDLDLLAIGERRREVANLAVHSDRQRVLASRGPIAAAASAPVAPCSSSRADSSGSLTVNLAIAGHATYERNERHTSRIAGRRQANVPRPCEAGVPLVAPWLRARLGPLADRDQRTGPVPARGRLGSPQHVGLGAPSEAQAGEGRQLRGSLGDHLRGPVRR